MRFARLILGTCLLACATACVSTIETIDEGDSVTLIVTRTGESVQLGWQSDTDHLYTVLFVDESRSGNRWQALPGATRVPGNGGNMTYVDTVPEQIQRYYRLSIEAGTPRAVKPE